jgi:hypothetical protein
MVWGSTLGCLALLARFQPSDQIAFQPTNGSNTDLNGRWKSTSGHTVVDGGFAQASKFLNGGQAFDRVIHVSNLIWHLPTKNQSCGQTSPVLESCGWVIELAVFNVCYDTERFVKVNVFL